MADQDTLTVGIAQLAPVWLDRAQTLEKVAQSLSDAAAQGCALVAFGEALVPGYPHWVEHTEGARFNSPRQKAMFAHYADQAVCLEAGHLDAIQQQAAQLKLAVVLGIIERPLDRGGHSLYCSLVSINQQGERVAVHRKLMPTYEERLVWSPGDGHGLRVHPVGPFTVGALNCWENWLPLVRAAMYAQGEDLHIASWPGGSHNTHDTTPFIAKEARAYALSACGLLRSSDIPDHLPFAAELRAALPPTLANGGSCLAAPDGSWVIEPVVDCEALLVATLEHRRVREERQNLDVVGHYSRPDVTQLTVNRQRQSTLTLLDAPQG